MRVLFAGSPEIALPALEAIGARHELVGVLTNPPSAKGRGLCFSCTPVAEAATALGVQGSGWAVLAWDGLGARPVVFQLFDQQGNAPLGVTPLLQLDVWEHAYYLDYQNVRADYVKAFWEIANWDDVARRFAAVTA